MCKGFIDVRKFCFHSPRFGFPRILICTNLFAQLHKQLGSKRETFQRFVGIVLLMIGLRQGAHTKHELSIDDRSADGRCADDLSADDRSADDRSADDRCADDCSAGDRSADDRSADDMIQAMFQQQA